MSTDNNKPKVSKRNVILALLVLVITNVAMGTILLHVSKKSVREQMDQRMLDVANTAAYMLNGDDMKALTAEDAGTEKYQRALDTLAAFQENIELDYIYGINIDGNNKFSFNIDPAPDDPGVFGESIETTDALISAANGVAAVDKESYSDKWGDFYSAYSPVFDSDGKVACVVGVDFSSDWYDGKLNSQRVTIIVVTFISFLIGVLLAFKVSANNRRRLYALKNDLDLLSADFQQLDKHMMMSVKKKIETLPNVQTGALRALASGESGDEIRHDEYSEIDDSLRSMQKKLKAYIAYIDSQTYVDHDTAVCNKAAYRETVQKIEESIKKGDAAFSVAFFDINNLKYINTNYGFEQGDELMYATSSALKEAFGQKNVYRIASDEFIAVMEKKSRYEMEELFQKFDGALDRFNSNRGEMPLLYVAKGMATYDPAIASSYRTMFIKAENEMRRNKADFHAKHKKV